MRSSLALLGGFSISVLGVAITLGTAYDLAGVLLIIAGGLVAALAPRVLSRLRAVMPAEALDKTRPRGSLGARVAHGLAERPRA